MSGDRVTANERLRQALLFGADDLNLNMQGRLSQRQAARIFLEQAVHALLVVVFLAFSLWAASQPKIPGRHQLQAALLPIFAGLWVIFYGLIASLSLRDLWGGQVVQADALAVAATTIGNRLILGYHLHFTKCQFIVSHRVIDAIVLGQMYRVYYTPLSRHLVAIESLEA